MSSSPLPDRRGPRTTLDGVLIVDKPIEWTSHDVVAKVRNYFRLSKVGHAGTLDPVATGVLVLLIGRATRMADQFLCDEKEYRFVIRFGLVTDTHDRTGKIVSENPTPPPSSTAEIERVLDQFRGPIMQMPPMFSAVKVGGHRLYKLGRKGMEVERASRAITVKELVLEQIDWPRATQRAVCTKGTYVRTLCHDIGAALGHGACMDSLQRLRSGSFTIEQAGQLPAILALTPDQFAAQLLPCAPGVAIRPPASPRPSILADRNQ